MTQLDRKTATRRALLDAATALFRDRGYDQTRNADIAAAAGMTIGALYFHFRDKEHLFLEALRSSQEQRSTWFDVPRRLDPATPLIDILTETLRELAQNVNASSWTPVIVDFWFRTRNAPEVQQQLQDIYDAWIAEIARFIDALQDGGWVDRRHDRLELASDIYNLGAGAQTVALLYGAPAPNLPPLLAAILTRDA